MPLVTRLTDRGILQLNDSKLNRSTPPLSTGGVQGDIISESNHGLPTTKRTPIRLWDTSTGGLGWTKPSTYIGDRYPYIPVTSSFDIYIGNSIAGLTENGSLNTSYVNGDFELTDSELDDWNRLDAHQIIVSNSSIQGIGDTTSQNNTDSLSSQITTFDVNGFNSGILEGYRYDISSPTTQHRYSKLNLGWIPVGYYLTDESVHYPAIAARQNELGYWTFVMGEVSRDLMLGITEFLMTDLYPDMQPSPHAMSPEGIEIGRVSGIDAPLFAMGHDLQIQISNSAHVSDFDVYGPSSMPSVRIDGPLTHAWLGWDVTGSTRTAFNSSVWCYVSEDYIGTSSIYIRHENVDGTLSNTYNLDRKGTWQLLTVERNGLPGNSSDTLRVLGYVMGTIERGSVWFSDMRTCPTAMVSGCTDTASHPIDLAKADVVDMAITGEFRLHNNYPKDGAVNGQDTHDQMCLLSFGTGVSNEVVYFRHYIGTGGQAHPFTDPDAALGGVHGHGVISKSLDAGTWYQWYYVGGYFTIFEGEFFIGSWPLTSGLDYLTLGHPTNPWPATHRNVRQLDNANNHPLSYFLDMNHPNFYIRKEGPVVTTPIDTSNSMTPYNQADILFITDSGREFKTLNRRARVGSADDNWNASELKGNNGTGRGHNLIDTTELWTNVGTIPPGWQPNGAYSINNISVHLDPWGHERILWHNPGTTPTSTTSDGGFTTPSVEIVNGAIYRFGCWIHSSQITDQSIYMGLYGVGGNILEVGNGNVDGNPYFIVVTLGRIPTNEWLYMVGYAYPEGSRLPDHLPEVSIYRMDGSRVNGGYATRENFLYDPNVTHFKFRTYMYYGSSNDRDCTWAYPRVDRIDGSEPSLDEILGGYDGVGRGPISFNLEEDLGLDWHGPWTVGYSRKNHTDHLGKSDGSGYLIDSLGGTGSGYIWWGKDTETNVFRLYTPVGDVAIPTGTSDYMGRWCRVVLTYNGSGTLKVYFKMEKGDIITRSIAINMANYDWVSSLDTDLNLNCWHNYVYPNSAEYDNFLIGQRHLNDSEVKDYLTKTMSIDRDGLHVNGIEHISI